jgi:hypothetical protein
MHKAAIWTGRDWPRVYSFYTRLHRHDWKSRTASFLISNNQSLFSHFFCMTQHAMKKFKENF